MGLDSEFTPVAKDFPELPPFLGDRYVERHSSHIYINLNSISLFFWLESMQWFMTVHSYYQ